MTDKDLKEMIVSMLKSMPKGGEEALANYLVILIKELLGETV